MYDYILHDLQCNRFWHCMHTALLPNYLYAYVYLYQSVRTEHKEHTLAILYAHLHKGEE